ncbi:hypothetical protein E2C01_025040 [Portunus trituberculatus]|uniref:Secreted protein n=1 Tax=Portunus trituberculatus TaxID=210409 RepID=A0A5B7EFH9_PORTR|nr:hypothetical protein [Portunus trituberculatus]
MTGSNVSTQYVVLCLALTHSSRAVSTTSTTATECKYTCLFHSTSVLSGNRPWKNWCPNPKY